MERITSRRNPLCIHMKKLGESRSYRHESNQFLCDGIKLLEEALMCGADICSVLTASDIPFPLSLDTRVYYAEQSLLDSLSPLKNAQDMLFTCMMPRESSLSIEPGVHILLDRVQDPGNVGTIIRTAFAFGIDSVILTDGCADEYNPKTIRASMGAVFRQKIIHTSVSGLSKLKRGDQPAPGIDVFEKKEDIRIIGATLDKDNPDLSAMDFRNTIIAIGSEGSGLSDAILSLCDGKVTIPMNSACESLNAAAAAAVIMWEARGKLNLIRHSNDS